MEPPSQKHGPQGEGKRRFRIKSLLLVLAGAYLLVLGYNRVKPLPDGVSVTGPPRDASGMGFLHDLTFRQNGDTVSEQEIFHRVFSMIDSADAFIVLDMFLFNGEHGGEGPYPPLSGELTNRLLERKEAVPGLSVFFITDEINNFYGAYTSPEIQRLREAGIAVITTRMTRLRDSNPVYSAAWRILAGWMGTGGPGWLPNFLSGTGQKVTARAYLKLLNFKANHRKLLVTEKACLVASANPHDASGFHSNIAFAGTGAICADLLGSERSVAAFSSGPVEEWPVFPASPGEEGPEGAAGPGPGQPATRAGRPGPEAPQEDPGTVQLVTEGKILQALLADLDSTGPGDRIDLAMFYLSHRQVVGSLLDAAERGAEIRVILDPNKDAFGHEKGGIPNRQTAGELVRKSGGRIEVRWYDTHGEQFHTKMVRVDRGDTVVLMGGSANLTRRNISDYNLETDLRFVLPPDSPLALETASYFRRLFENRDGVFTAPFQRYKDDSLWKRLLYRVQEFTGISSF